MLTVYEYYWVVLRLDIGFHFRLSSIRLKRSYYLNLIMKASDVSSEG